MAYIDVSALAGVTLLAGIDPVTRDFHLSAATANTNIPIDIYKEMRICKRLNENLRGYENFLASFGNVPKGGGKYTERYVQQLLGTRFIPFDTSQELTVIGVVITDDGQEGVACFDRSPLTSTTVVDISYIPPQVEVIRTESEVAAIKQAALGGVIHIDTTGAGFPGTTTANNSYIGTAKSPSDNLADALIIAVEVGINYFEVAGTLDLDSGVLAKYIFDGVKATRTVISVNSLCNSYQLEIRNAQVYGDFDGLNILRQCLLGPITGYSGFMDRCGYNIDTVAYAGTTTIIDCFSNVGGDNSPTQDLGGSGANIDIAIRGWIGGCKYINRTDALSKFSADIISGHQQPQSTISAGKLRFNGVGRLTDSSTGTADIDATALVQGTGTISDRGYVAVDSTSSYSGNISPNGNELRPVNNISDAILIAIREKVTQIRIHDTATTQAGDDLRGLTVSGISGATSSLIITAGTLTQGIIIKDLNLNGDLDGLGSVIERCYIGNVSGISKFVYESYFYGTAKFSANTAVTYCRIGPDAPGQTAILDFDGNAITIIVSGWDAGRILFDNMITNSFGGAAGTGGRVIAGADNTGGTVVYGGALLFEDTLGGVLDDIRDAGAATAVWESTIGTDMSERIILINKLLQNELITDKVAGTITLKDDNGDVLLTAPIWEDKDGTVPYAGTAINKRDRLT